MSRFLFFIYRKLLDLLFLLAYPFLLLFLPKDEKHERLGWHIPIIRNCIWVHAASVGEVNASKNLILEMLEQYPDKEIILTTTSLTGRKTARTISERLHVHLLPLDIPLVMNHFIMSIRPDIVILIETEIWPVMLYRLKRMKVPVIWVNARISDRSYPKYKKMHIIWNMIRDGISQINTQSELDAERFRGLGFGRVINMYNLKFALKLPSYDRKELREKWQIQPDAFVLAFGSSRPGEEAMLHDALPLLRNSIKNLFVILVPRHLNRLGEVKAIFSDFPFQLHSNLHNASDVIIVDRMGILTEVYALSDIAVIGGSFFDFGGHNPLEAAYYSLPIIMGNYHSSCRDSVEKLEAVNGIKLSDVEHFSDDVIDLANDEQKREAMGKAAREVMEQYAHSLTMNLESIGQWLKKGNEHE